MNSSDNPNHDSPPIADQNIERLLAGAYLPEEPDAAFVQRVTAAMHTEGKRQAAPRPVPHLRPKSPRRLIGWIAAAGLVAGIGLMLSVLLQPRQNGPVEKDVAGTRHTGENHPDRTASNEPQATAVKGSQRFRGVGGLTARPASKSRPVETLSAGKSLETRADQRRRVALDDGSVLYLNHNTAVTLDRARHVTLRRGEIYVEVAPQPDAARFTVAAPSREIVALGTKFNVCVEPAGTSVLVTQGKVQVSGMSLPLLAGQQLGTEGTTGAETPPSVSPAPRATHALEWTRELIAAAQTALVPASKYSGGALVALNPQGQEMSLSLRKYHVDVHIEDGLCTDDH